MPSTLRSILAALCAVGAAAMASDSDSGGGGEASSCAAVSPTDGVATGDCMLQTNVQPPLQALELQKEQRQLQIYRPTQHSPGRLTNYMLVSKCLTLDSSSGAVKMQKCSRDRGAQDAQNWFMQNGSVRSPASKNKCLTRVGNHTVKMKLCGGTGSNDQAWNFDARGQLTSPDGGRCLMWPQSNVSDVHVHSGACAAGVKYRWQFELPFGSGRPFPNASDIKYCFDPQISPSSKNAFLAATRHFTNFTCLRFNEVPADTTDPALENCKSGPSMYVTSFEDYNVMGCHYSGGRGAPSDNASATLNLRDSSDCSDMGSAVHLIGHAVGMDHEMNRPDRDDFVTIRWKNIVFGKEDRFFKNDDADTSVPYDYESIMHYGQQRYGKQPSDGGPQLQTLVAKRKGGNSGMMGQNMGLTYNDAKQVGRMYNCAVVKTFELCSNDPNKCSHPDRCICHHDPHSNDYNAVVKTTETNNTKKKKCGRCRPLCERFATKGPPCGCKKVGEHKCDEDGWCCCGC